MNSSFRFESDPVFVCLTASGAETAQRLRRALGRNYAQIHGRTGRVPEALADQTFSETIPHLQDLFRAGRPIIGLCAAGILIRALAPLLADKHSEPAVLSVSEDSQVVVPLLGGHHGANRLAEQLAQASGGVAALTTAGDRSLGLALDEPPAGWRVADPTPAKALAAALLAGETVSITRPEGIALDWPPAGSLPEAEDSPQRLVITERSVTEEEAGAEAGDALTLHPPVLALGIGCERDCPADQVAALVANTLAETGYSADAVACVVSIDLKSDETAILAQAAQMGVPARFFDAATLEVETPRLQTPSDVVFREVGCHGVAEGAALAAVGPEGTLVVAKRKAARCTVALARAATVLDPSQIGRARGQLFVVGIGPGRSAWRTPEVSAAIAQATDLVGYGLYLDLLGPLAEGKARHQSELGEETERARKAVALAAEGRTVALVCSGDAGIYALATLVFEVLEQDGPAHPDWAKIAVQVCPGISALQAAAARAGAPIGHDFCAISLSDLLTPVETVEQRVKAAAEGDFVIAFYNPVSKRRRVLLEKARDILLDHRPPETPVILARNLGRDGEEIRVVPLATLTVDMADMLTLVMIGASTTRQIGTWVYTPRGYAKKRAGAGTDSDRGTATDIATSQTTAKGLGA